MALRRFFGSLVMVIKGEVRWGGALYFILIYDNVVVYENSFTRQEVIKRLDFVLAINTDEDVFYLYEGLKVKLSNLTDEEWTNVRDVLPFNLLYSDEDRVLPEETLPLS